jgi:hypothetical protein
VYSICYEDEGPSYTVSDVDRYVIIRKLLQTIFNMFPVFINRMIKSRRVRWAGYVARMGVKRNVYRILVRKPKGKRPLGRPRGRRVDNIKIDLREIRWDGMEWIDLA